jgi:PhnB protein
MPVQSIPPGFHSVTPYLYIRNAAEALDFYKRALNATELFRLPAPDGKIMHAEIKIGDSIIMLADEFPEMNACSPQHYGGSAVGLMVYCENVDALFAQALSAGGKEFRPIQNQFYGDRSGTFLDPFGHQWTLSTHVEDVSPEEIDRRFSAMMQQQSQ